MTDFYNEILKQSFLKVINEDYNKFLESIVNKYGKLGTFDLESLKKDYNIKKLVIYNNIVNIPKKK